MPCSYCSKLIGIADGLDYLHSSDVIHEDLGGVRNFSKSHIAVGLTFKQANIIVDDSGRPCIMGFSLHNVLPPLHDEFSPPHNALPSPHNPVGCCVRWAEPGWDTRDDLFEARDKIDIFSFAMVIVEVTLRCWTLSDHWLICSSLNVGLHWSSTILPSIRCYGTIGYR